MKKYCEKCDPEMTIKIKWSSKQPCVCPCCGSEMVEINEIESAIFQEKIVEKIVAQNN
jgi:hypothetical protein